MASTDPTDRPSGRPSFTGSVSKEKWSPERVALGVADTIYGWFPFAEDFPLIIILGSGAGLIWLLAQLPLYGFLTLLAYWLSGGRVKPGSGGLCCLQGLFFILGMVAIVPISYTLDNYFKQLRGQRRDRR